MDSTVELDEIWRLVGKDVVGIDVTRVLVGVDVVGIDVTRVLVGVDTDNELRLVCVIDLLGYFVC